MSRELKESSAVQTHINILQSIVSRMANNSSKCKTWAITVISAIAVILFDKGKMDFFYTGFAPLVMFFLLDSFYLGLERFYRKSYDDFVKKVSLDKFDFANVYKLDRPEGYFKEFKIIGSGILSVSTTPFYISFGVLIYMTIKPS